jgi:ACS family D-galactonate transporter-like MFS transporter
MLHEPPVGCPLACFFGIVISYVDRGKLSIAAPAIMRDFRIGPSTMGVLLSAFFWTYAAFQIPAGLLVDRLGIRRAYAAGFLMWSVSVSFDCS